MSILVEHHSERWLSFKVLHPRERLRILGATAGSRYRPVPHKDKNGKVRPIMDPSPELKYVQGAIREKLLLHKRSAFTDWSIATCPVVRPC